MQVLLIIFALNHLREWIAPDYNRSRSGQWKVTQKPSELFSREVYDLDSHKVIRQLCNGSKHLSKLDTGVAGSLPIDDWPAIDSVGNFDDGPPTVHLVNGELVDDHINRLLGRYALWFSGQWQPS